MCEFPEPFSRQDFQNANSEHASSFRNEIITNRSSISAETLQRTIDQVALLNTHWSIEGINNPQPQTFEREYQKQRKEIAAVLEEDRTFGVVFTYKGEDKLVGLGIFSDGEGLKGYEPGVAIYGFGYVLPEYRKQGIFGRITHDICATAKQLGFTKIVGMVVLDGRSKSVLLKPEHGFQVTHIDDSGYENVEKVLNQE